MKQPQNEMHTPSHIVDITFSSHLYHTHHHHHHHRHQNYHGMIKQKFRSIQFVVFYIWKKYVIYYFFDTWKMKIILYDKMLLLLDEDIS